MRMCEPDPDASIRQPALTAASTSFAFSVSLLLRRLPPLRRTDDRLLLFLRRFGVTRGRDLVADQISTPAKTMPVPIIAYGAQTGSPPVVGSTDMPLPERFGGAASDGAGSTVRDGELPPVVASSLMSASLAGCGSATWPRPSSSKMLTGAPASACSASSSSGG